jgi:rhodanese-related sulfurtransferase
MWQAIFGRNPRPQDADDRPAAQNDVAPAEAQRRAQAGSLLLDVREPGEFHSGHAPGAKLIPLGQLPSRLDELPRDREIITVCRSGNRSSTAAGLLRRAGFGAVRNLSGGMTAWARSGMAVER